MSDFVLISFGLLWALVAIFIGLFIKGIIFKGRKSFKAGLLLIFVSWFLGLAILGLAITSI